MILFTVSVKPDLVIVAGIVTAPVIFVFGFSTTSNLKL